jgi:hypothetical protein
MDGAPVYDRAKLDSAVARFRESNLNPAEAMIASVELALESLGRFCTEAGAFRTAVGDAAAAGFAREDLNELINALQDSIPPTIRAYNALLRDSDGGEISG